MTIFRHVAKGTTPGESWSVTLHTTSSEGITAAATAWSAAWNALWSGLSAPTDNINQLVPTQVETTELTTSQLDPVTYKQVDQAADAVALPGTSAAVMLPYQCAAGVTWLSAVASRSGRGRIYLPPLAANALDIGRIEEAAVTIIKNAAGNLLSTLTTATIQPVIFNRTTHATTPITAARVGDVFDTQRRRRDKLEPVYQIATI